MMIHAMVPLAFITTLDLAPLPAPAQQAMGWQAWYGCWEQVDEAASGDIVCMLPGASPAQVRMVTVSGGVVGEEVVLHADGVPRPVEEGGCTGTTTAEWSRDGRRLFVGTDLDCDGYRRVSRGALAMLSESEWVDVQAAAIFDQHLTRTLRYRAVSAERAPAALAAQLADTRSLVRQTARVAASAPLSADDVVEASARMPAPALQALLTLKGSAFALSGRDLVRLADAGVPGDVIDVMVALSHPQQFAIRQPEPAADGAVARGYGRMMECYDPMLGRVLYGLECDSPFAMSLYGRYGYSRYRYSPWSYDPWRSRGGTTVIIVEPRVPETPSVPWQPSQLVRGSGYTRGSAESSGTAQPRPAAGASAGSSAAGSSPASTTTSSGSSGATSTGRTAVPRNDNGNGGGGGQ